MPLRRSLFGALGVLCLLVGVATARRLSSPVGRAELELGGAEAVPLVPPKLAPLEPASHPKPPAPPPEPSPAASVPPPPARPAPWSSTLIVGIDRRPDSKGAGLADALIVAVFDGEEQRAAVISVPRDLWVAVPEHGDDRINVIPAVARRQKKNPLELFRRVLGDTLGLPVEHVVLLDLDVFERTVDAVGGVELDVPCPIVDSFLDERVPGGRRRLDLAAGRALLDGPTAAMYVRSRHGRSDFGRSRRQQAVLLGVRDRVLERDGLVLLPKLWSEIERSVATDLTPLDLFGLARRALELERSRLHGLVLAPPLTIVHRTEDGKSVLLPERDAIAAAVAKIFSAPAPGKPVAAPCPPADVAIAGR